MELNDIIEKPLEISVLTDLVRFPEKREYILSRINENHFKDAVNKALFRVISGLIKGNMVVNEDSFIDMPNIKARFKSDYDVYSIDIFHRVTFNESYSISLVEQHVKDVLHKYEATETVPKVKNDIINILTKAENGDIDTFAASELIKDLLTTNIDNKRKPQTYEDLISSVNDLRGRYADRELKSLFGRILNVGELGLFFGAPSTAKTPFAVDLCDRLATGGNGVWFGEELPTTPLKTLLIQLELRAGQLQYRIKNRDFSPNFHILDLERANIKNIDIDVDTVLKMAIDYDLVVIDNYSALADSGDVSNQLTALELLKKLRLFVITNPQKTIILMMHVPKLYQKSGLIEMNNLEGSYKLSTLADAVVGFGKTENFRYIRNLKHRSSVETDTVKKFAVNMITPGNLQLEYLGEVDISEIKPETSDTKIKSGIDYFAIFKDVFANYSYLRYADMLNILQANKHVSSKPNAEKYVRKAIELKIISKLESGDYALNFDFDKDYSF